MPDLILRRASVSRPSGEWNDDDFDVFDGDELVGRIYRVNAATELWWWGRSRSPGAGPYGTGDTLDAAKVAFRAECLNWRDSGA